MGRKSRLGGWFVLAGLLVAAILIGPSPLRAQPVDVKIVKPTAAGGSAVKLLSGENLVGKTDATPFGDFSLAVTLMPGRYELKVSKGKALEETTLTIEVMGDGVTELRGRLAVETAKKGKLKLSDVKIESTPSDRVKIAPAEPAPAPGAPPVSTPPADVKPKSETKP